MWRELCGMEEPPPPYPNRATTNGRPGYRGTNYESQPPDNSMLIKKSDFSHQLKVAEFQADVTFLDVRYPYWQFPYHGPWAWPQQFVKTPGAGAYHHQSNLAIVGRPRPITDWQTPLVSPYWVPLSGMA